MFIVSVAYSLLLVSDAIMAHDVNTTVNESPVLPCTLMDPTPINLENLRFSWQDERKYVLYSFNQAEEMPKHVKELYRARVTAFPQEMMRGNISVKLGKVTLEDDQRFFQAFATLVDRDGRSIRSDPYEPICQMTLHVAVSYQDVSLAVSEETMTAVCTAQRGFPKPLIEWRLQNPSDNSQHFLNPKDVNTSAVQDPQNHLYSLRSTIDIPAGRYRSVTCLIHNPTINVTLFATHLLNKGEAERSLPGWATALIAAAAVACFHLSSSHSYAAVA